MATGSTLPVRPDLHLITDPIEVMAVTVTLLGQAGVVDNALTGSV